ncbi:hypothetical protein SDC9_190155 [bioreactor metagenome]|uniref:Uncharacterized protein n=1 Tax=bioreactor metagenome TaxID=1076179 RepID=A0A645HU93_9ZZZZ
MFAFFLVQRLGEAGLGIANSASALINTGLLTYALKRKLKTLDSAKFAKTLMVLIPAAFVAGAIAWFGGRWCQGQWGIRAFTPKLVTVFLPAALAGVVYFSVAFACKVESVREMANLITRKFKRS